MNNFEYYGLFLTEESKAKLKKWLWNNGYGFDNDTIKGVGKWYLDHVTLLHITQVQDRPELETRLECIMWSNIEAITFEINGIGESHNALAFRCNIMPYYCA
ncbi:hypothetical protein PhiCrAssBcn10_104, partial [Bacteroides phage PhiCrAssBcn10]